MYNVTFLKSFRLRRYGVALQPYIVEQRFLIITLEELKVQLNMCRESTSAQSTQRDSFWITAEELCIILEPL